MAEPARLSGVYHSPSFAPSAFDVNFTLGGFPLVPVRGNGSPGGRGGDVGEVTGPPVLIPNRISSVIELKYFGS